MERKIEKLAKTFEDEVACMREMLSSFEREQATILRGSTEVLSSISKQREVVAERAASIRLVRQELQEELSEKQTLLDLLRPRIVT